MTVNKWIEVVKNFDKTDYDEKITIKDGLKLLSDVEVWYLI